MRRLFSASTLFILSGLFIFYATTIPWDFARTPALDRVSWIPLWDPVRGRPPSIPDLVQNVVLFLPFGFFGALSLRGLRARGAVTCVAVVGLVGFALSLFVEALQTMSLERSPSASDLTTNFTGTVVGAAAAVVFAGHLEVRLLRALDAIARDRPGLLVVLAYTAAVSAGALAPFIPTLDVSALRGNVRQILDDPWGPKTFGALAGDTLAFAAVAFLFASEVPLYLAERTGRRMSRGTAAVLGALAIGALACALEFAQIFIIGHSPGVQDAAAGMTGALLGAGLFALVNRGPPVPARALGALTRRLPWLVLGFAVLAPFVRALSPFALVSPAEKLAGFNVWQFVPFWALFRNVNLSTFRNVFEAAIYYVPFGYALFALGRGPPVVFVAAFVLADVLEVLQIGVAGRTFDVTEGVYAGVGALLGAFVLAEIRKREPTLSPRQERPM